MMQDQVYVRALRMAGEPEAEERELLRLLSEAAFSYLEVRLREGLMPEDCRESFVTAASLLAVASAEGLVEIGEFKAGDLTVKAGTKGAQLRHLALDLMGPYLKDRFLFAGV